MRARILAAVVLVATAMGLFPFYRELSIPLAASVAALISVAWMAVALVREIRFPAGRDRLTAEASVA